MHGHCPLSGGETKHQKPARINSTNLSFTPTCWVDLTCKVVYTKGLDLEGSEVPHNLLFVKQECFLISADSGERINKEMNNSLKGNTQALV